MPPKRKRPPSRPPEDPSSSAPPSRRAKMVAKDSITVQLASEQNGRSVLTSPSPDGIVDNDTTLHVKFEKKEPLEAGMEGSGGSNSDVCAICLATRSDPTVLDNCVHSFCYTCTSQWMKYAGRCPLCMKKVERFWHHTNMPPPKRAMVVVAELKAAAEAERLAERGQSQPPLDEQECIRLRIRRLQRRLDSVQRQMQALSTSVRVDRSSELSKTNVRLVNEISKLEMLKRDVTTRGDLVGNIVFRSLIYKDKLEWSSIDRNALRVPFSPEVFSAHVSDSTERLRSFLDRELQIVWRCRKPNETKEDYARGRNAVVREIIFWCSETQINSPQFSRNLRLAGIYPGYLDRFQSELFEFASSMLSLRDFDRTSAYSSPELRQTLHRRNRRGNTNQEVVMLSDSDSDSGVIALDNRRNGHRSGAGDDVIVLSDNNQSDDEPARTRGESNYVRDEATSSNSEASNTEDLYARPACLLPRYPFVPYGGPLHVVDAFGSSRDLFQHLFTPFFSRGEHQNFLRSLNMPSAPVENDTTIVISSDDENDRSSAAGFDGHSRRTNSSSGQGSSSSQGTATPNDIAWLSPTNRSDRPGTPSQEVQVLPSTSTSSDAAPLQPLEAPRKPKSLFVPGSAKNLLPKGPIEVKVGENKLLAALWQERRNRCATTGRVLSDEASTSATNANGVGEEQKVEIVSADRGLEMENEIMDCTVSQNSNDDVEGSTMESDNIPAHPALGREPGSSVSSSGDSIVVVDVPPSLSRAEESTVIPAVAISENAQSGREKSHRKSGKHHRSWRSIFKHFRRKLQREKSQRKREKAYNFLIEMKQYEENRRRRESPRNHKDYATERRSRRTYSSSSNSVSSRGHRDDFGEREKPQVRRRSRSMEA